MPYSFILNQAARPEPLAPSLRDFFPRDRFAAAIAPYREILAPDAFARLDATGRSELSVALWDTWHLDVLRPADWRHSPVDTLSLFMAIDPSMWRELHAELVVLSMLHRGPARFPHARLLQELDTRWDEQH